jgi:hypothetical protein
MASSHLRLEQAADRRLAREQKGTQSTMSTSTSGDAALRETIEPRPKGRFGVSGYTVHREKPKAAPIPTGRIGPPAPAPLRFADALPAMYAPRPRPKIGMPAPGSSIGVMNANTKPLVHAPKVRLYGPAAIEADVARRGVVVTLSTDRETLPVQARGALMASDERTLRLAFPLLLAYKRGDPPHECNSAPHAKGTDATAVSVGPLGNLICAAHLAERA